MSLTLTHAPARIVPQGLVDRYAGPALVVAATCFNIVLCFVNTRHWAQIGNAHIIAVSLAIVLAGLWLVRGNVTLGLMQSCLLIGAGTVGLGLLNPELDLKILFDLLIAVAFYLLGTRSTPQATDRLLLVLMAIVLAFGMAELLAPDRYQDAFDILDFYSNKGALRAESLKFASTKFFSSAERATAEGRVMLPWLFGSHRVSSLFLEPVSMGNFAQICLAWLLSVRMRWSLTRVLLAAGTLLCVVLPDSRQAIGTCLMLIGLYMSGLARSRALATCLPFAVLAAMVVLGVATLTPGEAIGIEADDLQGRLLFSAKLLASYGPGEWLGLVASHRYTADTGYAYMLTNVGLPLALFTWLRVTLAPAGSPEGESMRGMVTVYLATSLCIGASLFSIKTAAILWFLYGAAQVGVNQVAARRA